MQQPQPPAVLHRRIPHHRSGAHSGVTHGGHGRRKSGEEEGRQLQVILKGPHAREKRATTAAAATAARLAEDGRHSRHNRHARTGSGEAGHVVVHVGGARSGIVGSGVEGAAGGVEKRR